MGKLGETVAKAAAAAIAIGSLNTSNPAQTESNLSDISDAHTQIARISEQGKLDSSRRSVEQRNSGSK